MAVKITVYEDKNNKTKVLISTPSGGFIESNLHPAFYRNSLLKLVAAVAKGEGARQPVIRAEDAKPRLGVELINATVTLD